MGSAARYLHHAAGKSWKHRALQQWHSLIKRSLDTQRVNTQRMPATEVELLEQRFMLSGDLLVIPPTSQDPQDSVINLQHQAEADLLADYSLGGLQQESLIHELIFIDTAVEQPESLIEQALGQRGDEQSHVEVVYLDAGADGVQQITQWLTQYSNLKAIHIISHGEAASVQLGNTTLDNTSLDAYAEALSGWQSALAEGADLLFYGCSVAEGETGRAFVERIAALTGADVAASDDMTGAESLGGNWVFEYTTGVIETRALFSAGHTVYDALLADLTFTDETKTAFLQALKNLDALGNRALGDALINADIAGFTSTSILDLLTLGGANFDLFDQASTYFGEGSSHTLSGLISYLNTNSSLLLIDGVQGALTVDASNPAVPIYGLRLTADLQRDSSHTVLLSPAGYTLDDILAETVTHLQMELEAGIRLNADPGVAPEGFIRAEQLYLGTQMAGEGDFRLNLGASFTLADPNNLDSSRQITSGEYADSLIQRQVMADAYGRFALSGAMQQAAFGAQAYLALQGVLTGDALNFNFYRDASLSDAAIQAQLQSLLTDWAEVAAQLDQLEALSLQLPLVDQSLLSLMITEDGRTLGDLVQLGYYQPGGEFTTVLQQYVAQAGATYSGLIQEIEDYLYGRGAYSSLQALISSDFSDSLFTVTGGLNTDGTELALGLDFALNREFLAQLSFGDTLASLGFAWGDGQGIVLNALMDLTFDHRITTSSAVFALNTLELQVKTPGGTFHAPALLGALPVVATGELVFDSGRVSVTVDGSSVTADTSTAEVTAGLTMTLSGDLFGVSLETLAGGVPGVTISFNEGVATPWATIASYTPDTSITNFTALSALSSLEPQQLMDMLSDVVLYLESLRDSGKFDGLLPFTNVNLGQTLDFSAGLAALFNEGLQASRQEILASQAVSPRLSDNLSFDLQLQLPGQSVLSVVTITVLASETSQFTHINQLASLIDQKISQAANSLLGWQVMEQGVPVTALLPVAVVTELVKGGIFQSGRYTNAQQQLRLHTSGGDFRVRLGEGSWSADISSFSSAIELQRVLENLPEVGKGNVQVTGEARNWQITFTGALSGQDVVPLEIEFSANAKAGGLLEVSARDLDRVDGLTYGRLVISQTQTGTFERLQIAPSMGVQFAEEQAAALDVDEDTSVQPAVYQMQLIHVAGGQFKISFAYDGQAFETASISLEGPGTWSDRIALALNKAINDAYRELDTEHQDQVYLTVELAQQGTTNDGIQSFFIAANILDVSAGKALGNFSADISELRSQPGVQVFVSNLQEGRVGTTPEGKLDEIQRLTFANVAGGSLQLLLNLAGQPLESDVLDLTASGSLKTASQLASDLAETLYQMLVKVYEDLSPDAVQVSVVAGQGYTFDVRFGGQLSGQNIDTLAINKTRILSASDFTTGYADLTLAGFQKTGDSMQTQSRPAFSDWYVLMDRFQQATHRLLNNTLMTDFAEFTINPRFDLATQTLWMDLFIGSGIQIDAVQLLLDENAGGMTDFSSDAWMDLTHESFFTGSLGFDLSRPQAISLVAAGPVTGSATGSIENPALVDQTLSLGFNIDGAQFTLADIVAAQPANDGFASTAGSQVSVTSQTGYINSSVSAFIRVDGQVLLGSEINAEGRNPSLALKVNSNQDYVEAIAALEGSIEVVIQINGVERVLSVAPGVTADTLRNSINAAFNNVFGATLTTDRLVTILNAELAAISGTGPLAGYKNLAGALYFEQTAEGQLQLRTFAAVDLIVLTQPNTGMGFVGLDALGISIGMENAIRPAPDFDFTLPSDGKLTADAVFKLRLDNAESIDITVAAALTADNTSVDDLRADIQQVLNTTDISAHAYLGTLEGGLGYVHLGQLIRVNIVSTEIDTGLEINFGNAEAEPDEQHFYYLELQVLGNTIARAQIEMADEGNIGNRELGLVARQAIKTAAVAIKLQDAKVAGQFSAQMQANGSASGQQGLLKLIFGDLSITEGAYQGAFEYSLVDVLQGNAGILDFNAALDSVLVQGAQLGLTADTPVRDSASLLFTPFNQLGQTLRDVGLTIGFKGFTLNNQNYEAFDLEVVLRKAATQDNTSVADLAADLNAAIHAALDAHFNEAVNPFAGHVFVVADDSGRFDKLRFITFAHGEGATRAEQQKVQMTLRNRLLVDEFTADGLVWSDATQAAITLDAIQVSIPEGFKDQFGQLLAAPDVNGSLVLNLGNAADTLTHADTTADTTGELPDFGLYQGLAVQNWDGLLDDLTQLASLLGNLANMGELNLFGQKLPTLNKSLHELLSLQQHFNQVYQALSQIEHASLQTLQALLGSAFGLDNQAIDFYLDTDRQALVMNIPFTLEFDSLEQFNLLLADARLIQMFSTADQALLRELLGPTLSITDANRESLMRLFREISFNLELGIDLAVEQGGEANSNLGRLFLFDAREEAGNQAGTFMQFRLFNDAEQALSFTSPVTLYELQIDGGKVELDLQGGYALNNATGRLYLGEYADLVVASLLPLPGNQPNTDGINAVKAVKQNAFDLSLSGDIESRLPLSIVVSDRLADLTTQELPVFVNPMPVGTAEIALRDLGKLLSRMLGDSMSLSTQVVEAARPSLASAGTGDLNQEGVPGDTADESGLPGFDLTPSNPLTGGEGQTTQPSDGIQLPVFDAPEVQPGSDGFDLSIILPNLGGWQQTFLEVLQNAGLGEDFCDPDGNRMKSAPLLYLLGDPAFVVETLDTVLGAFQSVIDTLTSGLVGPIIGPEALKEMTQFVAGLREGFVSTLTNALNSVIFNYGSLDNALRMVLFDLLYHPDNPYLNFLRDYNGDGIITPDDIVLEYIAQDSDQYTFVNIPELTGLLEAEQLWAIRNLTEGGQRTGWVASGERLQQTDADGNPVFRDSTGEAFIRVPQLDEQGDPRQDEDGNLLFEYYAAVRVNVAAEGEPPVYEIQPRVGAEAVELDADKLKPCFLGIAGQVIVDLTYQDLFGGFWYRENMAGDPDFLTDDQAAAIEAYLASDTFLELFPGWDGELTTEVIEAVRDEFINDSDLRELKFISYTTEQIRASEQLVFAQSSAVQFRMNLGQTIALPDLSVDFDIGVPGLNLAIDGGLGVSLDWDFFLGFGLDVNQGFYLVANMPGHAGIGQVTEFAENSQALYGKSWVATGFIDTGILRDAAGFPIDADGNRILNDDGLPLSSEEEADYADALVSMDPHISNLWSLDDDVEVAEIQFQIHAYLAPSPNETNFYEQRVVEEFFNLDTKQIEKRFVKNAGQYVYEVVYTDQPKLDSAGNTLYELAWEYETEVVDGREQIKYEALLSAAGQFVYRRQTSNGQYEYKQEATRLTDTGGWELLLKTDRFGDPIPIYKLDGNGERIAVMVDGEQALMTDRFGRYVPQYEALRAPASLQAELLFMNGTITDNYSGWIKDNEGRVWGDREAWQDDTFGTIWYDDQSNFDAWGVSDTLFDGKTGYEGSRTQFLARFEIDLTDNASLGFSSGDTWGLSDGLAGELDDFLDGTFGGSDGRLTYNVLTSNDLSDLFETNWEAYAQINLHMRLGVGFGDAIQPDLLPAIEGNFHLTWSAAKEDPDQPEWQQWMERFEALTSSDYYSLFADQPGVWMTDIALDMGTFFSNFLEPVINVISVVTDPFAPVIEQLTKPIPGISDLMRKNYSLVDMAVDFSKISGGNAKIDFIVSLISLFDTINSLKAVIDAGGSTVKLPVFDVLLLAGNSHSQFALDNVLNYIGGVVDFGSVAKAIPGETTISLDDGMNDFFAALEKPANALQFPIIDNPGDAVLGLLFGKPIDLVTYTPPDLEVAVGFRKSFPVYPPLFVGVGGEIKLQAFITLGFDTYGVIKFLDSKNVIDIMDGFYISDNIDSKGVDQPEVILSAELVAFAELNAFIARGGVEGGIRFEGTLDLCDPDQDGKVRGSEIYAILDKNPAGLVSIDMRASAFIRAYLELLALIKYVRVWEHTFMDITLFEWSLNFCDQDPVLASMDGTVLVLNTGSGFAGVDGYPKISFDASDRLRKSTEDGDEHYTLSLSGSNIEIVAVLPNGQEYTQTYRRATAVHGYSGVGTDVFDARELGDIPVYFVAGSGDNTFYASNAASGNVLIGGTDGVARLYGGSGNDMLIARGGQTIMEGQAGDDTYRFLGEWGQVTLNDTQGRNILDFSAQTRSVTFDDAALNAVQGRNLAQWQVSTQIDLVKGGQGNDWLNFSGNAQNLMVTLTGLNAGWVTNSTSGMGQVNLPANGTQQGAAETSGQGFTFTGFENVLGGKGSDVFRIQAGASVSGSLRGDTGSDNANARNTIDFSEFTQSVQVDQTGNSRFGGSNNISVRGFHNMFGGAGDDLLIGNGYNNLIVGNGGSDSLSAIGGHNLLVADSFRTYRNGDNSAAAIQVSDYTSLQLAGLAGGHGNDGRMWLWKDKTLESISQGGGSQVLRGAAGNDILMGSLGSDRIFSGEGNNTIMADLGLIRVDFNYNLPLYMESFGAAGGGNDVIFLGGGNNLVIAGNGNDRITAADRADSMNIILGDNGRIGFKMDQRTFALNAEGLRMLDFVEAPVNEMGGTGGNNLIQMDSGSAIIFGGAGSDAIIMSASSSTAQNARFIAGDHARIETDANGGVVLFKTLDVENSTGGDDFIRIGDGADSALRHLGSNFILGGMGSDTILISAHYDQDGQLIRGQAQSEDIIIGDNGEIRWTVSGNGKPNLMQSVRTLEDDKGGDDILVTGNGGKVILGGFGADEITALDGTHIVFGDNAELLYDAVASNGVLRLAQSKNEVLGGNDIITLGEGFKLVSGGIGDDQILIDAEGTPEAFGVAWDAEGGFLAGVTGISAVVTGFAGALTVPAQEARGRSGRYIAGDNLRATFDLRGGLTNLVTTDQIAATGGADQITIGRQNTTAYLGLNVVFGGMGGDQILVQSGSMAENVIFGDNGQYNRQALSYQMLSLISTVPNSGGNDNIRVGSGDNILIGGFGNDTLRIDSDDQHALIADHYNRSILLGDSGEILFSGGALQRIESLAFNAGGSDTVTIGDGDVTFVGGFGGDTLNINSNRTAFRILAGDNARLVFSPVQDIRQQAASLTRIITLDQVAATGGNDVMNIGIPGANTGDMGEVIALGGVGSDAIRISGERARVTLIGDNGEVQRIAGHNGHRQLVTSLDPTLGAGGTLHTVAGDYVIIGGSGGDNIRAGKGTGVVFGDHGRINYSADGYLSSLTSLSIAQGGNDTIELGVGSGIDGDKYVIGGVGSDNITLSSNRGSAAQPIERAIAGDNVSMAFDALGRLTSFTTLDSELATGGNDRITLSMSGEREGYAITDYNVVAGGMGDDEIIIQGATRSDDVVSGDNLDYRRSIDPAGERQHLFAGVLVPTAGGNDTIRVGAGDKILFGGQGNDRITANTEAGDRTILFGDAGNAVFNSNGNGELIQLLSTAAQQGGQDNLTVTGGELFLFAGMGSDTVTVTGNDDATRVISGASAQVNFDQGVAVLLQSAGPDQVEPGTADTHFILPDTGINFVIGGPGFDTLTGSQGNAHRLLPGSGSINLLTRVVSVVVLGDEGELGFSLDGEYATGLADENGIYLTRPGRDFVRPVTIVDPDDPDPVDPEDPTEYTYFGVGSVTEDVVNQVSGRIAYPALEGGLATFDTQQNSQAGLYGYLTVLENGAWRYHLAHDASGFNAELNAQVQALTDADQRTEYFTVTTIDGSTTTIIITVNGRTDTPADVMAEIEEDAQILSLTGRVLDPNDAEQRTVFQPAETSGVYGVLQLHADGHWEYLLDNDKAQSLREGEQAVDLFLVQTLDGAVSQIAITVVGVNDVASIEGDVSAELIEDALDAELQLRAEGQLRVIDPDAGEDRFDLLRIEAAPGAIGHLQLSAEGDWVYSVRNGDIQFLHEGEIRVEAFRVYSLDGTASEEIHITLIGVNNPAQVSGQFSGAVVEKQTQRASGSLTVVDADRDQSAFQATTLNSVYGQLQMTAQGQWQYQLQADSQALRDLNRDQVVYDRFTLHTLDGTAFTVEVRITGETGVREAGQAADALNTGGMIDWAATASTTSVKTHYSSGLTTDTDVSDDDTTPVVAVSVQTLGQQRFVQSQTVNPSIIGVQLRTDLMKGLMEQGQQMETQPPSQTAGPDESNVPEEGITNEAEVSDLLLSDESSDSDAEVTNDMDDVLIMEDETETEIDDAASLQELQAVAQSAALTARPGRIFWGWNG
ncbi:MAG: VCBS domain-containing protein [Nitrincola lacisaponensis]|uniref:VCBS domain-containing protein n=1 Tax=Nitrincola lacisaponensis TaxID=267850 RepID=UPI00391D4CB0